MRILLESEGLKEAIAKMESAQTAVPNEIRLAMYEALEPVKNDTVTYPAQPPPRNPKYIYVRGSGTQYVPTGHMQRTSEKYDKSQTITVEKNGNDVEGTLNSGASYWRWLRGDMDGYEGAWMHKGVWKPIKAIWESHVPRIVSLFELRIAQWLDKK